ncbi:inositol monophosphatase [Halovenus sp. WSH3]|uniref:fructose-bisphosphatase n=1 Tax=Halovenus carboxidivorans TaxID=2692199 RepID=A0A6B0T0M5_9EURY|nr:inositol monophosphatase [Halovenus carboxidivorans]MXR50767.1 inositol monophosphatase [Halovenus carboxidivorans]
MDSPELARVAEASAAAGAAVAADRFRTELDVQYKDGKTDVVTQADRDAQAAVVDRIREATPNATVCGEEGDSYGHLSEEGIVWVIDPIDGTNNYVRGNRRWATSVACLRDGEAVAAANFCPAVGDRYVGTAAGVDRNGDRVTVSDRTDPERCTVAPTIWWDFDRREEFAAATSGIVHRFGDLRRIGCAQAALSMVATGALDGVITNRVAEPWDSVAGAAMVEWAGGTVTDIDGNAWQPEARGLVASNGRIHEDVLAAAREIDAAAEPGN